MFRRPFPPSATAVSRHCVWALRRQRSLSGSVSSSRCALWRKESGMNIGPWANEGSGGLKKRNCEIGRSDRPSWTGRVGYQEMARPGWLFKLQTEKYLIHHPVCGFAAATPPVQEGRSLASRNGHHRISRNLTCLYVQVRSFTIA